MAKGRKRKQKAKADPVGKYLRPTAAREAHNDTRSAGMARRIIPPIETLYEHGKLCERRYTALAYYRDQANLAERSPIKDSCDFSVRGGGHGPGAAIMSAVLETGRMERDLGELRSIVQAVARDDMTLARWCIQRYGGRERYDSDGKLVAIVPVREKTNMAFALQDLRMAADRIVINGTA